MASKSLLLNPDDPAVRYINTLHGLLITDVKISAEVEESITTWKSKCSYYKNTYVRIHKSDYVFSIVPELKNKINGIWDLRVGIGYKINSLWLTDINQMTDNVIIIPSVKLNLDNELLISNYDNQKLNKIETFAKDIFSKLILDQYYRNKSKDELAIKAVQFSNSFNSSIEEYKKMYFSVKENYGKTQI